MKYVLPFCLIASAACAAPLPSGSPQAAIGQAQASQVIAATFSASDAFSPVGRGEGSGAAYMTLENVGSSPIVIHSLSTPAAGRAELHRHAMSQDGVMRMEKVDSLTLPPHGNALLRPGGMHAMLFDLKAPLAAGSSFPLTFHYNDGALMTTEVVVLSDAQIEMIRKDSAAARPLPIDMYKSGREGRASDIPPPAPPPEAMMPPDSIPMHHSMD